MECDLHEIAEREPTWWDGIVDGYLSRIDALFARADKLRKKGEDMSLNHELVAPNSRLLVKMTVGALLLVFAIVLCSCAVPPPVVDSKPAPTPRSREPMRLPSKSGEQLYVKRESVTIKQRETGSHTGSLWADTRPPRSLYSEEKPSRTGEVIVVAIPEDLRYSAPAPSSKEGGPKPGGTAGKDGGNGKELVMTDPDTVGVLGASSAEPLKELRMEIVAIEPTGDVFLRGAREYSTNQGMDRKVSVMAKVPRRSLSGYTIDAKQLTAITVHEDFEGNVSDYAANGWDKVVSRKISGFVPDLNAELATLEDVRSELKANQKALSEQQKGIREERERLLKERAKTQAALDRAEAAAAQAEADAKAAESAAADVSNATAQDGKAKTIPKKAAEKPKNDQPTAPKKSQTGGTRP